MARNLSDAELSIGLAEFWPEGSPFPPTAPWLAATATRSGVVRRLKSAQRRGELQVEGGDDEEVVASSMLVPAAGGAVALELLLALSAAGIVGAIVLKLWSDKKVKDADEDDEDSDVPDGGGTNVTGEDCPCDPMHPNCWC